MDSVKNQVRREFLGICGLNFAAIHDSSSRIQMMSSHLTQRLVFKGVTNRYIQTGLERELGKYTFSLKIPKDAKIIKIINRYKKTYSVDSIKSIPETVIIFQEEQSKEVGCVRMVEYFSAHQYFGFMYKPTKAYKELNEGHYVEGGTILADSPTKTEEGDWMYGRECNVALMSNQSVGEDGVWISEELAREFAHTKIEKRICSFGNTSFPLNTYGTVGGEYKIFPDIGDCIRDDGVLIATRPYDKMLSIVEQSIYSTMKIGHTYDSTIYAHPGARIIDIKVWHDPHSQTRTTLDGMDKQCEKYFIAKNAFYNEIVDCYNSLVNNNPNIKISREFHKLINEALMVTTAKNENIIKLYKKMPLDDWRIEFTFAYDVVPDIGSKITGLHGDKGVICKITPRHMMPRDADGNYADIVAEDVGTNNRMNIGRLIEIYLNSASREVIKRVRKLVLDENNYPAAVDMLALHYSKVSRIMYERFISLSDQIKFKSVRDIAFENKTGLELFIPPEHEEELIKVIMDIEKSYPPTYGPVTFTNVVGKVVTTKFPVRIGSMYIIVLEKDGSDWSAVSSGVLQHNRILAPIPKSMKYSKPVREQSPRVMGEAETRNYVSYCGPHVTAELLERNNSPESHREVVMSIFKSTTPTNIACAVDRTKLPYGQSRSALILKQELMCAGIRFNYVPEN